MKVWVFLDGRQQGPFEKEVLLTLPGFNENTKVWFEGLPKWYPAGILDELRDLFDGSHEAVTPGGDVARDASENSYDTDLQGAENETHETAEDTDVAEEEAVATEEVASAPVSRFAPGQSYKVYRSADVKLEEPCPPTYLAWSIVLLICCCSPVSIAGIIVSAMVSVYYSRGDIVKSRKASDAAAWLVMVSIALGFLPWIMLSSMFG